MKLLIAIVRPFVAQKVIDSLPSTIDAIQVNEVKGFGRQKSYLDRYTKDEFALAFLPKVEISIWLEDRLVQETIKNIVAVARSGRMGDGKILVLPVVHSLEIASDGTQ